MNETSMADLEGAAKIEEQDQKVTLPAVIAKMRAIANEQYGGKIYDSVYSIFMHLTTAERRLFLKGLINIVMIVEDKTIDGSLVVKPHVRSADIGTVQNTILQVEENINGSIASLEEFNNKEMIKLKSRLVLIVVVFVLGTLAAMGLVSMYLSQSKAETLGMFTEFGKIIAEVLGL